MPTLGMALPPTHRMETLMRWTINSLPTKTTLLVGSYLDPRDPHRRRRTFAISTLLAALVSLSAFPAGLATAQTGAGGAGGVPGVSPTPGATPGTGGRGSDG